MIRVTEVKQTCGGCPSQWSGTTDDGKTIYVRYRYGCLEIELDGQEILDREIGDGFHGFMSYEELREQTTGLIEWPYDCH